MANKPEDALWIKQTDDGHTRVGLSEEGRDSMGTISFAGLPKVKELNVDDKLIEVEGDKSVIELPSPVKGNVVKYNQELEDHPENLNSEDDEDNWIVEID